MSFELIYPAELRKVVRQTGGIVIDVRDSSEYSKQHWEKALNYSYDGLMEGRYSLPRGRLLIFYCDHGGASMQIARKYAKAGYQTASVVGGYVAMEREKKKS